MQIVVEIHFEVSFYLFFFFNSYSDCVFVFLCILLPVFGIL